MRVVAQEHASSRIKDNVVIFLRQRIQHVQQIQPWLKNFVFCFVISLTCSTFADEFGNYIIMYVAYY